METLQEIKAFVEWIPTIGVTGLLALLAFPRTRKWLGFTNGEHNEAITAHTEQIVALREHAKVANEEMGEIRDDVKNMREDIGFIKGKVSNL